MCERRSQTRVREDSVPAGPCAYGRSWRAMVSGLAALALLGTAGLAGAAPVDLFVAAGTAVVPPGAGAILTFQVGNLGASSTSAIQLTVATAPYVNFDRAVPLPAGCQFLYQNPDRVVSEIVACTLSGLATGERQSVALAMTVDGLAPVGQITGLATVLPVMGSADLDTDLANNNVSSSFIVGRSTRTSGRTNLALSGDMPALGGTLSSSQVFEVTNNGPDVTAGPSVLAFRTAPFVNVDQSRPLPAGCQMLYVNPNPGVPELVLCVIPAGMASGTVRQFRIPIALVPGGPIGPTIGGAALRVDDASGDADPDRADNFFGSTTMVLAPLASAIPPVAGVPLPAVAPPASPVAVPASTPFHASAPPSICTCPPARQSSCRAARGRRC